jgi:putative NIF3 family GTP cyclohydrolase 1 type 2
MTAHEVHAWLRSLHPVPEPSVDRIIVGGPQTPVHGIAVVWMPAWAALRTAVAQGANVVIAHEPTFYHHHDLEGIEAAGAELPPRARAEFAATCTAKRRWIEAQGLVVIRCHDVLDAMPGGVVDTLVRQLGFGPADVLRTWNRYRVVRIEPAVTARALAQRLAAAFAALGQPGVAFYGDPERRVGSLGVGTGYGCEPWRFVELGADMGVTIDDRIKTWTEAAWSADSGFPLAVIHHGTAEEWGVRQLAERVQARWPEVPVRLIPQGYTAEWIAPRVP